jgi:predicted DNA-binding transcriptional regulator AlpA
MSTEWTTRPIESPTHDLITAGDVARLFRISEDTIRRLVASGELPEPLTIGKQTKVWDWRAVTYYRLRVEMASRLAKPNSVQLGESDFTNMQHEVAAVMNAMTPGGEPLTMQEIAKKAGYSYADRLREFIRNYVKSHLEFAISNGFYPPFQVRQLQMICNIV